MSTASTPVTLTVNSGTYRVLVEPRRLLSDVLRDDCGLTGTHVGCEHGVCGACTILFDGVPARACLLYAVQTEGHEIITVEAFAVDGELFDRATGIARGARSAMRFLHAGHCRDHGSLAPRTSGADRGRGSRGSVRQPLPVHRISQHRCGDPQGSGAAPVGGVR